jgi:alcohol dehydrogenase
MADLLLRFPNHVFFGPDVVNRLGQLISDISDRCLIFTESVLSGNGTIEHVENVLDRRGISAIIHDDISPRSTTRGLEKLVSVARASHTGAIVGIGGMRVLAAARIVSAAAGSDAVLDDVLTGRAVRSKSIPYIEVPSSYRNHFMLKDQCLITDGATNHPRLIQLPAGTTHAVVVDPNLTFSMSPKYAAAAMLDTFLAAVEGYISNRSSFLSDTLLLEAIKHLAGALEGITETPSDPKHRLRASQAGLMTAFALSASSQGIGGALAYTINSMYTVPKSWIATVLLPHVLDTSVLARPDKLKRVAHALGEEVRELTPTEAAHQASAAVRRMIGVLELPGRLREMDLAIDDLVEVSEIAASLEMSASSPVPHTANDLYDLVKLAY